MKTLLKKAPEAVSAFTRTQVLKLYPALDRSAVLAERASGVALIGSSAIAYATGTGFLTVIPPTIATFFAARAAHKAGKGMWSRVNFINGANVPNSEDARNQFIAGLKKSFTTAVLVFAAVQVPTTLVSAAYQNSAAKKATTVQKPSAAN